MLTSFILKNLRSERCKSNVNLVDLVKSLLRSFVQIVIFQSLFLNLLFEQIANSNEYSNEYLLPKIGVETAENEPLKVH